MSTHICRRCEPSWVDYLRFSTAQAAAIDRLVYALYGLTAAESKIVEGGDE